MGGGASKDGNTEQKEEDPNQQNGAARNGKEAAPTPGGTGKAPVATKLVCTVEDAKSNSYVPFQSSVQDHSTSSSGFPANEDTNESSSESDDEELAEENKFVFGEVAIDMHVDETEARSPGKRAPTPQSASPTTTTPSTSVFMRPFNDEDVKVHGVSVGSDPWRQAKVPSSKVSPLMGTANGSMQMGDLKIMGVDPRTQSVSSWFCAPTRHAVPYRYTFTAFGAQAGPIRGLSASSEGTQVAVVVSGVKQCFLLDVKGNLLMSVKGHLDPVLSCAQSKDGKFLVTTSADCTAVMWDLNNGKKLRELPVSTQVNSVTVSDESDAVATTSTDDVVHLWDSKTCDPLIMFQRHTAGIFSIAFSRRGGLVASGSSNGEIFVWSQSNGEVKNFLAKHKTPVLALSFSHDGQRLVSVDRETLRMWDLFTGHCIFCRDTQGGLTYGVDEDHGKGRKPIEDTARYTCCSFVAGNLVATALTSKQLLLLDPSEGKELLTISTKALVTSLSCTWMGDVIFVGDFAGNLYRWELQFSARDIQAFHLDAKPPTKEKKGQVDKD